MKILILGSKEYPFGTGNRSEDPLPSGGTELYIDRLLRNMEDMNFIVITRKFSNLLAMEKTKNIEIYRVPFIRGFYLRNPSFNILSFFKSLTINFDIIIANDDIAGLIGLALSIIKNKPLIAVCHGIPSEQPQYNPIIKLCLRVIEKLVYSYSSENITHSPQQLSRITSRYWVIFPGFDKKRAAIIPKKKKDKLREKYKIGNKKVIVFVGRLIRVKGIEYLLPGLKKIQKPYICFIVGDGPQAEEYKRLAEENHVNAIFTGFRSDVNMFLSIADVFVLPSLSESLSYSMLEAANAEVPIVVTDLGIIPDNSAIIIRKKNPDDIAMAINTLFENTELAYKISKNAKKFVSHFNWKRASNQYMKVIRRAL